MASMEYESEQRGYDDEPRGYDRERSRSPRRDLDDSRLRSASPNGRDSRGPPPGPRGLDEDDEGAVNPGSNLFVTGIHPSLTEQDVSEWFEKYGAVEKCNIMRDPHSKESRGFGFVKMETPEGADAAKEGLQGQVNQGRTLSIEKARRAKPRTPTPGKYYGPPKREPFRGRGGGRFSDRYDDRRGGGGGYGRRDDNYGGGGGYRGSRYGDREDRGYGRDRDDYGRRGVDRYASRDDRYYGGREERRGGGGGSGYGGGGYDRPPPPSSGAGGYGDAPPPRPEGYSGGRSYDDRGDDYRYSR